MALPAILQQLGRSNMAQAAQNVKRLMNMVRAARNPQAALEQMIMSNPQLQPVMDIIRKYGGDPMRALWSEAEANGIDPNEIMNLLK